MKRTFLFVSLLSLAFAVVTSSYALPPKKAADNTLTKKEIKEGWKLLFDGKTSDGWMLARTKAFPVKGWVIDNGTLHIDTNKENRQRGDGGDLVTKETFTNFELMVDFMYTEGANGGIKYFVDIDKEDGRQASIGCEFQVLDDQKHPDAKMGKDGNRTLASLYDLIPAKSGKLDNGPNQWNTARIVVNGNKVQHFLNGQMTVEYVRGDDAWRELVAGSKYKSYTGFGEVVNTHILIQDHYDLVYYKNIKIKELK